MISKIKSDVLDGLVSIIGISHTKCRIVVAMSGGVDSTVTAALLADFGYDVIGITLQLYDHGVAMSKKGACCAGIDIYDAQVAAANIGINHYVFNYQKNFKESVIDQFVNSYARGETPIPCILCNQKIKFKDLLQASQDLDADYMATGHYVKKVRSAHEAIGDNDMILQDELHRAIDKNKDQSYFLFTTTSQQLSRLLFPLGNLSKDQTRLLADYYGLSVAEKPDSQDICFIPQGNYRDVVKEMNPSLFKSGEIVNMDGKILGYHNGIANYTIGQRRGLGLSSTNPLYVCGLDPKSNRVIVAERENVYGQELLIKDTNWLVPEERIESEPFAVKLNSSHVGIMAILKRVDADIWKVQLFDPYFGITPGQACVVYDDTRLLGGGWIIHSANTIKR